MTCGCPSIAVSPRDYDAVLFDADGVGAHLGAMAGSVDLIPRVSTGSSQTFRLKCKGGGGPR